MRYYIETYTEKGTDFFCIKPTTKDFEEYLSYKLENFLNTLLLLHIKNG